MINLHIDSIDISDGTTIEIPPNGLVVIVGPNNAGKSTFLSETNVTASNGPQPSHKVVRGINLSRTGTLTELEAWILANAHRVTNSTPPRYGRVSTQNTQIEIETAEAQANELMLR